MTGGWVDMRSDSCGFLLFSLLDTNMGPDPVVNGVKWGEYMGNWGCNNTYRGYSYSYNPTFDIF